ncbi:hypothetical protein KY329_00135 [Candidatus Woesearchaeota archaeon]|nr:hypothetical protein [Candidatus Woesearchaeota archaeon]
MSFMDKLLFWKKEEPPAEPRLPRVPPGPGLSAQDIRPPQQEMPPGLGAPEDIGMPEPSVPEFREAQMVPSTFGSHNRPAPLESAAPVQQDDHSLIIAKLDTIKAQLDAVLQRLERMEYAKEERAYQRRWR